MEPHAGSPAEPLGALRGVAVPREVSLMVGPEGGWAEPEWKLGVEKGARPITLGARTLRADAVPVAAISVLQFLWESD
jgi:16S rRNA (uracil1498-N3)-methyltransferase